MIGLNEMFFEEGDDAPQTGGSGATYSAWKRRKE